MSVEPIIAALSTTVTVDALYYLVRAIRHRLSISGTSPRLIAVGARNEPSPEAQKAAKILAKEMEREKGIRIEDLNNKSASEVIEVLEQLMVQKFLEGTEIDSQRGDDLLGELRKSSSP